MALNIKPLGTRVVVKVQEAENKTKSGIYIPDSAKEKPQRGEIVAVGKGTKDEAMELKAGDIVLYGKYAGTSIEIDGEDYLIMNQSDVLAIV
ncbi:MAG: co-chaperone GroES [Bacteroidales bacterium]|nr:co-chaperone GroES [Bacteroidales bacterium]